MIRRFAAMLYDGFLIVALWMTSTTILVAVVTEGEEAHGLAFQLFLYFELAAFYIYFWQATGQTLGMQVWKIRVLDNSGELMTLTQSLQRFAIATVSVAFFGLGFVWLFFNKRRLTLHDMASHSEVIYLGKKPYKSEMD